MIEIRARIEEPAASGAAGQVGAEPESALSLTLVFQDRQRSRQRVQLSNGQQAVLLLPRGTVLRGGDLLSLSDGRVARVEAAAETVSTVRAPHGDAELLARAAYHLGNRHVPLQVGAGFLRYLCDHVLDAMVVELGLSVLREEAPFEPESGAYGRHTHGPGHHHGHAHGQEHDRGSAPALKSALGWVGLTGAAGEASPVKDSGHVG
ncbi:MAG: UreE urease accessory domain protein [Myxococcaceae bacterium]|nr:UreE urease accessory domain protein [Myxococcaceae bacterium]